MVKTVQVASLACQISVVTPIIIYSILHLPYNGGFSDYSHKVSEKKAYNYLVFPKNCKILEDFKKNKPIYRLFRDRKKIKEAYLNGMPLF